MCNDYGIGRANDSFDWRDPTKNLQAVNAVGPTVNQGQCGSCWAHAASETFSDKLAIATNGSTNEIFSVQELVSCDTAHDMVRPAPLRRVEHPQPLTPCVCVCVQGCGGGWPEYAFDYMMQKGLPADTCYPCVTALSPRCIFATLVPPVSPRCMLRGVTCCAGTPPARATAARASALARTAPPRC